MLSALCSLRKLVTAILFFLSFSPSVYAQEAQEAQRMLLLSADQVTVPANGIVELNARCLDQKRTTPYPTDVFIGTGPSFSRVTIAKGGGDEFSLTNAIQLGIVSVTGNESTSNVRLVNNSDVTVIVDVPEASVVVPDYFDVSDDLAGLPYLLSTASSIDQGKLWAVRSWMDDGFVPDRENFSELDETFDLIQTLQQASPGDTTKERWVVQPFTTNDELFYALHSPESFFSNARLRKIVPASRLNELFEIIEHGNVNEDTRTVISVVGTLPQADIDAAALTISYGRAGFVSGEDFILETLGEELQQYVTLSSSSFGSDGGLMSESGDGGSGYQDGYPIHRDDGWVSKLLHLLKRGEARISVNKIIVEPWRDVMAALEIGVREARADENFESLSTDQLAQLVEERIDANLATVKERLNVPFFADDSVRTEVNADGTIYNRFYVEIWNGETRFALLELR